MVKTISESISSCFTAFEEVLQARETQHVPMEERLSERWDDEKSRLRLWTAIVGAERKGQSSLEFKIRDASHIREQIISLLHVLNQRLLDARNNMIEGDDGESVFIDEGSDEEDEVPSEIQELRQSVANIINCLFRIAILVRNPAQHDFIIESKDIDNTTFAVFDYQYIRDKLPRVLATLIPRLAIANTRRRRYFKHRERYQTEFIEEIEQAASNLQDQGPSDIESTSYALSETDTTTSAPRSAIFDDEDSGSELSQTSYALSSLTGGRSSIPSPPVASHNNRAFECPYCYSIINIRNTKSWIAHVFLDLQPYICLDPGCVTPNKLYTKRRQWLHHMKLVHPASALNETGTQTAPEVNCSLCSEVFKTGKLYSRHVSRHLQEVALFSLPRKEGDRDIEENDASMSETFSLSDEEGPSMEDIENTRTVIDNLNSKFRSDMVIEAETFFEGFNDSVEALQQVEQRPEDARQLIDRMKSEVLDPLMGLPHRSHDDIKSKFDDLESDVRAWIRALGLYHVAPRGSS